MNIIKFQDQPIEGNEFFNQELKGKYAYAVNFKWIFPFDVINDDQFIELSQLDDVTGYTEDEDYIVLDNELALLVDQTATDAANDIAKYVYLNKYATDEDITIDELKMFRTWLATQLLSASGLIDYFVSANPQFSSDMITSMLEYYSNEMTDSTTQGLAQFVGMVPAIIDSPTHSHCGCIQNTALMTTTISSNCDPLDIYTHSIYEYMVNVFSTISFWDNDIIRNTVVVDFKHYIDNIVKHDFPLVSSEPQLFADCSCLNVNADEQRRLQQILVRLSQSLQYIINEETSYHQNFIFSSLNDWSRYLYENMRW